MKSDVSSRLLWTCATIALLAAACDKPKPPAATCNSNSQCPSGKVCSNNTCVAAPCGGACTADQICADDMCIPADGANCASSASICPTGFICGPAESCERQCMMNSDCPLPTAPICNINNFVCAQCSVNSDCTNPGKPVCSSSGTCIQCAMDSDCYVGGVGAGQYCDTSTSSCMTGCLTVTDCSPGTKTCTGSGSTPGMCVECESDTDCTSSSDPVCNMTTAQCVQCLTDTDCADLTGQCDPTTNMCVECVENSICPRGQICQSDTCIDGCSGADGGSNCPAATPVCDTTSGANGTCVACLVDTDCPFGQICGQDPTSGANECIPGCMTDDRCQAPNTTTPYCDPTANGGLGQCVQCVRDSQCTANQVCDTTGDFCRCHKVGEACTGNSDCGYQEFSSDQDGGATFDCNAEGAACINVVRCGATSDPTYRIINQICSQTAQGLPCDGNFDNTSVTLCPTGFVNEWAGSDPSSMPNETNEAAASYSHMCIPEAEECTTCD